MSLSVNESPFRTELYTKEDMLKRFNFDMDKRREEGWAVSNIVWSPDSSVAVVTFTRLVQGNDFFSNLFPRGIG